MGVLIQGPWGKKTETVSESTPEAVNHGPAIDYPWHMLSGPKGTKPAEHEAMLADLQRLAKITGQSGGVLMLPNGWFWDAAKHQSLIDELLRIGSGNSRPGLRLVGKEEETHVDETVEEENVIPDDIA